MSAKSWNRMSIREKRYYRLPPPQTFRCRICRVEVTAIDRAGHLNRSHSGGDVAVCFEMVQR